MTAIIVGRLPKANFIVADSMVQLDLKVKSHKECRVQDKITDIELSEQFLVLVGEQLVADGANILHYWSTIRKIKYDLFQTATFEIVLEFALRYRRYHIDVAKSPIINQPQTDVYVASRHGIKYYGVEFKNAKYIVNQEQDIPENYIIINYKGNLKRIPTPTSDIDILGFSKEQLENEHQYRKLQGFKKGEFPLGYDFDNRFSSAIIPTDSALPIQREYPFTFPTDIFLAYRPCWDYVTAPNFRYSPPAM